MERFTSAIPGLPPTAHRAGGGDRRARPDLEACAPDGRRRTDVLIHGENGLQLGCEVQLSYETAPAVVKRTDKAPADGLSPL
ncbi:hypothetical protein GCM10009577_52330 [Streptomyces javensis]